MGVKLDGNTITFHSLDETQLYIRAAKNVFTLLPPESPEEGEKFSAGEWDLLFKIAVRMAQGDVEWATELVRSVVVPAVFMAGLEFTHTFDEDPKIFIVEGDAWTDAFYDLAEAEALAKILESSVVPVGILSDSSHMEGSGPED